MAQTQQAPQQQLQDQQWNLLAVGEPAAMAAGGIGWSSAISSSSSLSSVCTAGEAGVGSNGIGCSGCTRVGLGAIGVGSIPPEDVVPPEGKVPPATGSGPG